MFTTLVLRNAQAELQKDDLRKDYQKLKDEHPGSRHVIEEHEAKLSYATFADIDSHKKIVETLTDDLAKQKNENKGTSNRGSSSFY